MRKDLGLFKLVKLSLELYELVPGVLGNAAFSLGGGGLYRANVHRCLNGISSTVVTSYVRIEDAIIGLQYLLQLEVEIFRQYVVGVNGHTRRER